MKKKTALELPQYESKEAIIENLKDAGCCEETIERCLCCLDDGKKEEILKQLDDHRKDLLQKVHEGEKQIDCLDYLVYQIDRCKCKENQNELGEEHHANH